MGSIQKQHYKYIYSIIFLSGNNLQVAKQLQKRKPINPLLLTIKECLYGLPWFSNSTKKYNTFCVWERYLFALPLAKDYYCFAPHVLAQVHFTLSQKRKKWSERRCFCTCWVALKCLNQVILQFLRLHGEIWS